MTPHAKRGSPKVTGLISEAYVAVKPALSLRSQQGAISAVSKTSLMYENTWESDQNSDLIYYLSKHFPDEFTVTIASFKSYSKDYVYFVSDGPI